MSERVAILGVEFDRVDLPRAADLIARRLDKRARTFVITANPEFVMLARGDAALRDVARRADLVVADGTGISLASPAGDRLRRVPGRMLVDALVPVFARRGVSVFLLGAAPGIAERAAATLRAREPELRIAGTYAGAAEDDADTVARVAAASPDVLLVAFGMPKQEKWIARNLDALPSVRLAVGVGGVFDQLAGVRRVPPALFHRIGLEWAWRLAMEPGRWRRQRVLPVFALLVLRERLLRR